MGTLHGVIEEIPIVFFCSSLNTPDVKAKRRLVLPTFESPTYRRESYQHIVKLVHNTIKSLNK